MVLDDFLLKSLTFDFRKSEHSFKTLLRSHLKLKQTWEWNRAQISPKQKSPFAFHLM